MLRKGSISKTKQNKRNHTQNTKTKTKMKGKRVHNYHTFAYVKICFIYIRRNQTQSVRRVQAFFFKTVNGEEDYNSSRIARR